MKHRLFTLIVGLALLSQSQGPIVTLTTTIRSERCVGLAAGGVCCTWLARGGYGGPYCAGRHIVGLRVTVRCHPTRHGFCVWVK